MASGISAFVLREVLGGFTLARLRQAHGASTLFTVVVTIHNLNLTEVANHDVRGLEVAVNHALRMRVPSRMADLLEDVEQTGRIQRGKIKLVSRTIRVKI